SAWATCSCRSALHTVYPRHQPTLCHGSGHGPRIVTCPLHNIPGSRGCTPPHRAVVFFLSATPVLPEGATMYHAQKTQADCDKHAAIVRDAINARTDRKSTRLNSSHVKISYAVFCLKKKK